MAENMQMPLISVIIPIYNIEDCLSRCVHSITAQTYRDLEILLVDDGSTDNTPALCDALAEEDNRIRVFHKENGGSSSARNLGIRNAKGHYLGFVDSDDYIEPYMYEKLYRMIEEKSLQMAQISRDEISEDGTRRPDVCVPPKEAFVCPSGEFLKELLMHTGDCSYCTKLTARELFEDMQFPEGVLNEDFYLLIQMLQKTEGVGILPEQGYHVYYRMGSNTRTSDKNEFPRVYTDIVNHADLAQELVERHAPELHDYAVRFNLFQRLDYMLHIPVGRMNRENSFYVEVKKYLRKHISDTIKNPYLTGKNKLYLLLLTAAPKTVRRVHGKIRGL